MFVNIVPCWYKSCVMQLEAYQRDTLNGPFYFTERVFVSFGTRVSTEL